MRPKLGVLVTEVLTLGLVAGMTAGSMTSAWGNGDAVLGDRVWEDLNWNGLQDDGEPGVPGVEVVLFRSNPLDVTSLEWFAATTTGAQGLYFFDSLIPTAFYGEGFNVYQPEYQIRFALPTGYAFTVQTEVDAPGGEFDSPDDSDADPTSGYTTIIHLADKEPGVIGVADYGWDAGIITPELSPASLLLLGMLPVGLMAYRRRKRT